MTSNRIRVAALCMAGLVAAGAAHADATEDFFVAINRDNPNAIRSMLKDGFDVNTRNANGETGLYVALRRDSMKSAAAIAEAKSLDVNALSPAGESGLMLAALRGDVALSKKLIERGAAINKTGWSPLHYAASGKNPEEVKLLNDQGADMEARSPNGSTPLMMAAGYAPEEIVDLLLFWGADVKRTNDLNLSAADFAKQGGREALEARLRAAMAAKR